MKPITAPRLNESERELLKEFKARISNLKPKEQLVYHNGVTMGYLTDSLSTAKKGVVFEAYEIGEVLPVQRKIDQKGSLGVFQYIAVGR